MSQAQVVAPVAAKPKRQRKAVPAHPKFIDMVKDAIGTLKDRNGSSRQAICKVILGKYPSVNPSTMNSHVRKALKSGLESGTLTRPARSSATGATGRFKLGASKSTEPAKKKAAKPKKPASTKKRPAKKAGAKKTAKPKAKSPRKKTVTKKKSTVSKKSTSTKTKKASPKKKTKPATKKVAKKAKAKKAPKSPAKK
ncbi:sperm-specific H1/protamine-like protein type 2 [Dendronephthya gigantea]|uniref:sperm-specific H1/protamine-like protein type 2 n=1 Tax=Dendronephthya gigantea TaxID=151771 RepID=UPI00106BD54F|nr:sperm-specific H1/protamine-like protein type 2 [Dendronephthya gigantea]